MAATRCQNPNCPGPSNVVAIHSHNCPTGMTKKWSGRADGPTPNSAPYPEPCPDDRMTGTVVAAICTTCGWVQP